MTGAAAGGVSPEAARDIETDCARVLLQLFHHLDERRYGELAELFSPHGVWNRQGHALQGPAGVRQAMEERSSTARVRHVVTNLLVTPSGAAAAEFVLYLTAYMHDDGTGGPAPVRVFGPSMLLVVTGALAVTGEGWRVRVMTMSREFEFQKPE